MRKSSPIVFLLLIGYGLMAQTVPRLEVNADLEDLLIWLDENNPGLKGAQHEVAAAQAMAETLGWLPDPVVSLALFAVEVQTRVGPQQQKLGINQTIPWPGKLALERKGAREQANARIEEVESQRLQLHRRFKYLFADYYFLGKSIEINRDHLILLESLDSVVDTKYRTGETSYSNLVRIDVEIDRFKDKLATLEDQAKPVLAEMNALLGRDSEAPLSFPSMLHDSLIDLSAAPESAIFEGLAHTNPELRTLEHLQSAAQLEIERSQLARRPDFRLNLEYINTGSAIMPGVAGSGDDPIIFGVGVNIPWNRRKYRAMESMAQHRKLALVEVQENKENMLEAQLKRAFFAYRDARRKIDLYRDSILPKASEAWMVTLKSFESDSSDFNDVINTEQTLLEFKLSLHLAMADRTRSMADIELMTGVPLPMPQSHKSHGH